MMSGPSVCRRSRHQSKGRNESGAGQCSNGRAVLVGDFGMRRAADWTKKDGDDAIAARITGNHAGTTVNNHGPNARSRV
jgi:hypothetical protein